MASVRYEIYYEFLGINPSNPLAEEKSLFDVERDLDCTTSKLEDQFSGTGDHLVVDRIYESGTMMVTVSSNMSQDRISEKVKEILLEVGLFGKVHAK